MHSRRANRVRANSRADDNFQFTALASTCRHRASTPMKKLDEFDVG